MRMYCPECREEQECDALETRAAGERKRRRRECSEGHRFTTYEEVVVEEEARDPWPETLSADLLERIGHEAAYARGMLTVPNREYWEEYALLLSASLSLTREITPGDTE